MDELRKKVIYALDYCIKKEKENIDIFGGLYPAPQSRGYLYDGITNYEWTNGFYTGMLWLSYEITKNEIFLKKAREQTINFKNRIDTRIETLYHHDLGFLYIPSCVADYKITGNEESRETALRAAKLLSDRFSDKGGFIQAWGDMNDPKSHRLIIDCMMNIPLLFWAAKENKNENYSAMAQSHIKATLSTVIRKDFTTHHTYYYDKQTGLPLYGETHQGYSDDSCWARGQAWGIYGAALAYTYTGDESIIPLFNGMTDCYINKLPEDCVPYWDMIFTSGDEPRDTSASAIAICGILEMNKYVKNDRYSAVVEKSIESLIDKYLTDKIISTGLLKEGMYARTRNDNPECTIWGDYYFMEALVRIVKGNEWKRYW